MTKKKKEETIKSKQEENCECCDNTNDSENLENSEETSEPKTLEQCLTEENEALIAENEECKAAKEAAEKEKDETLETLQRHQAEFENFRKRTLKEKEDLRVSAAGNLLTELLPVLDNFERALIHGKDDPSIEGVKMVQKQMMEILIGSGLVIVGMKGEEFDPKVHDAISQEEKEGFASNTVTEVLQPGFMFHEKLLRPAMVKVAK
ncbi:MAG: nucleotide exchange factor GrpE [Clostridiales bacterium]